MAIQILEPTVAAQIAAGEVVERPASVIKEMIENALDAGAHRVNVEARGGGLRELKVQDDGYGIPADELELAFSRYATSKLRQAEELWNIQTLGFRGEALPSIASVSQLVCITRSAHEEVGTELRIAGGEIQARLPRGCSPGTSINVRHLFYNTPVRREYLRAESTEMSAISAVVQQYALAYPEVSFTLLLDGRLALQTGGTGEVQDVLVEIYGVDVARELLPLDVQYGEGTDAISIRGMLSPPGLTRSSRNYLHLFVNRRAIQARGVLVYVIEEAYHTLLMKGRHPLAVFDIRVHPEAVDVNVHPTKSEVRFRHQGRVKSVLGRAVREALMAGAGVQSWSDMASATESAPRRFEVRQMEQDAEGSEPARPAAWQVAHGAWDTHHSRWDVGGGTADFPQPQPHPQPHSAPQRNMEPPPTASAEDFAQEDETTDNDALDAVVADEPVAQTYPVPSAETPAAASPPPPATLAKLPPLRIVGQVGMTYIVAESPEGMYMIDQHATHERIAYERLMAQRGSGPLDAQELLMAETVNLPADKVELLLAHGDLLAEWGFSLDAWGEGMVRVRAVPAILHLENLQTALSDIADRLAGEGGKTPADWREELFITLACHSSVRAGQSLSLEEMRELLRQLERCENPRTCPHGRPTMVLLTPGELEKQFGRRV